MEITHKHLPNSRMQYTAELSALEVDEYYARALSALAKEIKISGFRPGKAPANLVRDNIKTEALREEAYTLAVQGTWSGIIKDLEHGPIQDPEVGVADFIENKPAKIEFEFDIRPEVTLKNVDKIKINDIKKDPIDDAQIDDVLNTLRKAHAKTVITLDKSKKGDKVEVDFVGSLKGVTKDKLTSKHFPVVIGEDSVIPGFAEELIGLKKNDIKKFSLDFPKDHFDKELAGQKIDFDVTVEEVYNVELPEIDDKLAHSFGHDKVEQLKAAVKEDLEHRAEEEKFYQYKASWLAEFEKCVKTELPISLVEAEVERAKGSWEEFLERRNLKADEWLARQKTTLEEMEKDWKKAATASVTIGLGLAKLATEKNKKLETNEEYQQFLDDLVKTTITKSKN